MKKQPKFYLPIEENTIKVPRFEESAGFYTTKKRSKIMAKIKGSNSKLELLLRKALWKANIRFRVHRNDLPGKPDVVIEKYQSTLNKLNNYYICNVCYLKRPNMPLKR